MASKTTNSVWSNSNKVGTSTGAGWLACPISTLNAALNNTDNVPANAKITGLKIHVTADFDCGMGLANVYLKYGFGSTNSISQYLLQDSGEGVKFTKTTPLEYPSGGVDIKSYLSSDISPFAITTAHGSYLAFRFYSTNVFSKTYYVNSLTLEVTYETRQYTVTVVVSPEGAGKITGAGTYEYGASVKLNATAESGYKFSKWKDGVTSLERTVTVTDNVTYTAEFVVEKIKNIKINGIIPKAIYFDESNIVYVVDGDIPELEPSLYDTVDGFHFRVQNTVPGGMTECKTAYLDGKKYWG